MPAARTRSRGFTLVELLVALLAMALLAVLSWRGLDGMARAQEQTQARSDEVLALQVGLAQWRTDLESIVQLPQTTALDWNGRVLRLTRHAPAAAEPGARVVAWTRRVVDGRGQWLRWQSPPLTTRGQLDEALRQADAWSREPGDDQRLREVTITPLDDWQLFYFRTDAWTNPLSSDAGGSGTRSTPPGAPPGAPGVTRLPDGVRLVLTLPAGQPVAGNLTLDWVRPTVGGGKS